MSERELPPGNANLPPSSDWVDAEIIVDGAERGLADLSGKRRWMLLRSGETVMWGEGYVGINFEYMAENGHEPSGYELVVGGEVGVVPGTEYDIVTPDGVVVGSVRGTVSHKATPDISPDVRCEVKEDE